MLITSFPVAITFPLNLKSGYFFLTKEQNCSLVKNGKRVRKKICGLKCENQVLMLQFKEETLY